MATQMRDLGVIITPANAASAAAVTPLSGEATVMVETSDVSCNATVGSSTFSLPSKLKDAKAALVQKEQSAAGTKNAKDRPSNASVDLHAQVKITGARAEDVGHTVETTQKYFENMIAEVEALHMQPIKRQDIQAVRDRMAQAFQNDFQDLLQDPRHSMVRQNSSLFVESLTKAENLLGQGSGAYVEAVRKLISTGETVTVVAKNLSYQVPHPKVEEKTGPTNIGTVLLDTLLCPIRSIQCRQGGANTQNGYQRMVDEDDSSYILKNIDLLLKPGRLTLVLGPPGSSKSSFLKAISGNLFRAPGKAKLSGNLEYNGFDVSKLKNLASWVSYVQQTDEHQPLLTTRETLEFAWKCRREPIFSKYPNEPKYEALRQVEVDIILATLGLSGCKDTYIGDATLKGVSGGEKRRVTLGEKLVTGSPVLALDEISTGLDAAATYDIVAHLSSVAHILGETIVVALLQPPPEVIDLFDDIICLAEGQIIYHGERSKVQGYFEELGFSVPDRVELGDFLQTLPTKDGPKFYTRRDAPPPKTAADFARLWKASPMFKLEEQEINATLGKRGETLDNEPQLGFFASLLLVSKFMMKLKLRQKAQLAAKLFSNVIMGSFFGSLFWQLDSSQSYLKSMLLFQVPSFVFSTAFPNVQVVCKHKQVYLKQLDASFYSATVFTLGQFLVSLPFILFDILCFGNIVYWCTGLARDPTTFMHFLFLVVTYAIAVNTAFSSFPFLAAKEDTSVMMAAVFLLMCILNAGLVATPDIIPTSAIWLFWLDPLAWVLRALAINEYHSGGDYDQNPCEFEILGHKIKVNERCGDYYLEMRQIRTEDYWAWASHLYMAGFTFFFLCVSLYAVSRVRFEEERSERVKQDRDEDIEQQQSSDTFRPPVMRRQESISIPRQQLCVKDLWYTVNIGGEEVDFLKGVSFHTYPGRSLALMGSSGAGKTTLMDVIAGRKTVGKWRGEILVDGQPKVQSEFVKYAAYVEQFGCHIASATVLESLQFSAELRLPTTYSATQKATFIQEQLEILELEEIQDSLCAGLSMEQNKRLTLGVELVANPSILFADEPTSSLDARAAAFVMRVLNRIAASGRTVICTIHQPSTEVFLSFDDLLLLKRGGEIAFFGELGNGANNLIKYFEGVPGVEPCPVNSNPGTWMLEVLGAGTIGASQAVDSEGNRIDFAAYYKRSALKRANDESMNEILSTPRHAALAALTSPAIAKLKAMETEVKKTYVRSSLFQFRMLFVRANRAYWRTISFTLARFVVVAMITFLFSLIFWQQPLRDVADIQSRVILLYFFSTILAMYNLYSIIPFAMARLPVFYRERATQMYSVLAHVTADSLVEIPYILLEIALGCGILYNTVGMNSHWERAAFYFTLSFAIVYLLTMVGLLFSSLMPDALSAQLSAISFIQILQIFSGVLVPKQNLPKFYQWLYYLSPFKWTTEGVIGTQFHGDDTPICAPFGELPTGPVLKKLKLCTSDGSNDLSKISGVVSTVEEFALNEFLPDFSYDNRWLDLGIVVTWIVAVRLLTILTVQFINHNRR